MSDAGTQQQEVFGDAMQPSAVIENTDELNIPIGATGKYFLKDVKPIVFHEEKIGYIASYFVQRPDGSSNEVKIQKCKGLSHVTIDSEEGGMVISNVIAPNGRITSICNYGDTALYSSKHPLLEFIEKRIGLEQ